MKSTEFDERVSGYKRKQARSLIAFFIVVLIVLAATIAILGSVSHRRQLADQSFQQLKAEVDLSSDLRTDRKLDRAEILARLPDKRQQKVINIALDLYEQKPPIPYKWGGKSPTAGFDSSGYVAWVLHKAGLLENPETYWSGALRQKLMTVPLEKREPGDVLFYEGGPCMFYLGGKNNLSIGSLPGGIATGDLDALRKPIGVGRY